MKTLELAKDIAFLCQKNNYQFNNTKIQKLLYLFVGFCLINNIDEIYNIDEKPKIWPYGPVFPKVHKRYQNEIKKCQQDAIKSVSDEKIKEILEQTVKKWGNISAAVLSDWSHRQGSPWHDLATIKIAKWNTEIDLEDIKIYFKNNVENVI